MKKKPKLYDYTVKVRRDISDTIVVRATGIIDVDKQVAAQYISKVEIEILERKPIRKCHGKNNKNQQDTTASQG